VPESQLGPAIEPPSTQDVTAYRNGASGVGSAAEARGWTDLHACRWRPAATQRKVCPFAGVSAAAVVCLRGDAHSYGGPRL